MVTLLLGIAVGYAARLYHVRYTQTGTFRKL